ncbi:MAG TPA: NADPH-dependent FMN reductase [Candidatus Binataceae bacterium]|nr:NADPH-dependent FMN reductase [Candidatus Binataceae bacterium]
MVTLVGILGSVTPPGRSLRALEYTLEAARAADPALACVGLNLADYKLAFADGRPPEAFRDDTATVVARITLAEALLLFSPVYRGSFSGSLKNLLDHLPVEALRGKPCGIVAIGATPHHYLGVDWHLRDVLTWFGALIAPTSVYLSSSDFVEGAPNEAARRELRELVNTLLTLRVARAAGVLGPAPLAARR